jgi:hypothetical protein
MEQIKNMKKLKLFSIEDNDLDEKIKKELKEMEKVKEKLEIYV